MVLRSWEDLPDFMQNEAVRPYYEHLQKKKGSLVLKRGFDIVMAVILLIILAMPMLVIGICIKLDSKGPVFYRQERVTAYGQKFYIHKFRTMVDNADQIGTAVTVEADCRITAIGLKLRKYRLDEFPQILDILAGDMSFVGTRPEATEYVEQYSDEMKATLLLPAGITSEASIAYKDEAELLCVAEDVNLVYTKEILPRKMQYNLRSIREFSLSNEIRTILKTALAVLR